MIPEPLHCKQLLIFRNRGGLQNGFLGRRQQGLLLLKLVDAQTFALSCAAKSPVLMRVLLHDISIVAARVTN